MSLELKLVQMSLELASSKAMEDMHHLYKRRMSRTSLSLLHTHDDTMECRADIGGDEGQPAGGLRRLSSSNVSQSWSAPRSKSWCISLASQAPLAFIPQAKSEATDASAVGGDTDEPKQFVSPFLSFRRHSSEGTRGSTTVLPTTLPYKGRISLESSRSGIPGVIFPVISAYCLIGCEVASSPISSSSGRNSNANAEWMLSPRASQ
jgi:hypothetical protein